MLENEDADFSFGPSSPAPYLAQTLPGQGALLPNYYGITHYSLGNYLGQISGQGSNAQTQADCPPFSDFVASTARRRRTARSARAACTRRRCRPSPTS